MELLDAIQHLGGSLGSGNDHDLTPSAEAAAIRERIKAEQEAKVEAERRRQIAEAVGWWRDTRPIAGTIAERYIIETRSIPRPDLGWPDCVRFLPCNSSTVIEGVVAAGALIVGVTTADGKLCAVQRIYLDHDAKNIRRDDVKKSKIKLTAGTFLDGTGVVHLPGPADGPLMIAEGPETGLSVWAATGFETWITVGSMAKVALPPDRRVCICRDDDKPHSAADKAITKAIVVWLTKKILVVVATPWSERRGEGDFNDVIREQGPEAVRARIDAALNPGPPPPTRTSIEEGRREVRNSTYRFVAENQAWDEAAFRAKADPEDAPDPSPPPVHLILVDTGVGKSRTARIEAVQRLLEMRSRRDKRNIGFAVPTQVLGSEQARLFEELQEFKASGLQVRIWRGRDADNPDAPAQKMCRNKDLVDEIMAHRLNVRKRACGICPHVEDCAYIEQEKMRGDIWLFAHNMLSEHKPDTMGKIAFLIVDENPTATFIKGHEKPIVLPLDTLWRVDTTDNMINTDRLVFLRRLALDTMQHLPDGPLPRDAFIKAGFTVSNTKEAHGLEWQTLIDVELTADMTRYERKKKLGDATINSDLGNRDGLWLALNALLDDGPAQSGWAELGMHTDDYGNTKRVVFLKYRKEVTKGWRVPTLILDATARLELLQYIWPGIEQTADIRVHSPHQKITQVRDNAFALTRLDVDGAKDDTERRHRERNIRALHGIICREARYYAPNRVLVVAQSRIEQTLLDIGNLPSNIELAHHNGVRGRDVWGDVRALVVSGRTLPPSTAVAKMTEALTGIAMLAQTYEEVTAWHEMASGPPQQCLTLAYSDPIGEALRWQACEAEVQQIIGRARGVNRTASNPVDILVLTKLPIPLPVELIPMSALELSPADRMLAAGGVILENPGDAASAYPELWGNRETAKKAFQKGKLGKIPYRNISYTGNSPTSLVQVKYKLKGQGKSEAAAWFDPGIVPRDLISRWLTDRLGELAWHTVEEAAPAVEPAVAPLPMPADAAPELITAADMMSLDADMVTDVITNTITAMSDAEKLAMRARLQARAAPADPDGVSHEVPGGYGDLLDPGAVFGCKPRYAYPPGPRRPMLPDGTRIIMVLAA